jgi:ABC-type phosphate transport system substrate-binding protein
MKHSRTFTMKPTALASIATFGVATLAASVRAEAASCPTGSNVVYVAGSSAVKPLLQAVTNALGGTLNIVYQSPGSCEGLDTVLEGVLNTSTAVVLAPNVTAAACTLPVSGATVDIAASDVYPATCTATFDTTLPAVPATMKDFLGPVQAMAIAVPSGSTENVISAGAAHMVFGFAANTAANTIAPWNVPTDIFVRFWDSSVLEMIAVAIGVPAGKWVNATNKSSPQTEASSGSMQTALISAGQSSPNAAIGILGSANLASGLKALAFKASGQSCAYFPDSSSSAGDKINVRQGRYAIWGPEHLVANVDSSGNPVGMNGNTAAVQAVIDAVLATGGTGGSTLTDAQVAPLIDAISAPAAGFVPWCAMQVTRTSEVGPEASYSPPQSCSCRFEMATGAALPGHTCTACTSNASCVSGAARVCRYGYCETN